VRTFVFKLLLGALSLSSTPAFTQTPSAITEHAATPLDARIAQLPFVLGGQLPYADYFAPSFLAAVPEAQLKGLSDQLIAQFGKPLKILSVTHVGPSSATVQIEYEKAIATADISVGPAAPNKIVGLLIKGFETKDDTPAKIDADFATLPGTAGYLIEKIATDGTRTQIAGRNVTQQFAVASTFKLYVLSELAAQVDAGRRKWSDIVPLTDISYSSTATQGWARDTPVTLQTLATWMISVSDNAATDTLIRVLGREAIEKKLLLIGHSNPERALPLLTTVEAFALKTNSDLGKVYQSANEAEQRALLQEKSAELIYEKINLARLGSGPVAIDSIEWFAAPTDLAVLLSNMRSTATKPMLDILSVNKGINPASAAKWAYLGYKGGSEPGVISMSFLAKSMAGIFYSITGSWNNSAAAVDNAVFVQLMTRLLDSVAG